MFEKEILESMTIAKSGLEKIKNLYQEKFKEYNFKII